jgi:hypothetical protein
VQKVDQRAGLILEALSLAPMMSVNVAPPHAVCLPTTPVRRPRE